MNTIMQDRLAGALKLGRTVVDDQDVGLVVRYKGSQPSATVEVSSAGDITFKHGVLSSEAVDSTIDSGGNDPGVIDVSDANANTFGQIVDMINASPNWEAFIVDALRADNANASTGSLLALSATQAHKQGVPSGVRLFKDTSKVLNLSLAIKNKFFPDGFTTLENKIAECFGIVSNNTYGSGTSLVQIYRVNPVTNAETKIFERAGGATTVEQVLDKNSVDFGAPQNEYLLVRLIGSAACTGFLSVLGKIF